MKDTRDLKEEETESAPESAPETAYFTVQWDYNGGHPIQILVQLPLDLHARPGIGRSVC